MTSGRIGWARLPGAVVAAVSERLGMPFTARDTEHSAAAGIASLLEVESGALVFVKGQRERAPAPADGAGFEEDDSWWGPGWSPVDELDLEEAVNPHLPPSAPRVLWRLDGHGWHLLAFEGVRGRDADFVPGSPDLAPVAAALAELAPWPAPPGVRLPTAWDRWGYYCADADCELLAGSALLHTDPASTNVLVEDGRARLVDWSWATAGPAWIDTALWGMRLVSTGGHSPEQAWRWAARVPGWTTADPKAIAVLAQAEARRWHDLAADQWATAGSIARSADEWAAFLATRHRT
ncbi:aminoglycoside phosphotransferase [Streptomyces yaizuensis]|uniref:Aminoglycoside phosphotransferase n=1 Tax=Streptomyces yaizuensis TaxID=2989713 RepID=A0ABQ5NY46_9ACTN|nr:aminoglycoside phosphotransferase [Streptomyces sp. YSPA8]GLF95297.1 aminoglycoside phosphotransferase [Streptomyces sp. YSPA8]